VERLTVPRWAAVFLALLAVGLLPWTLWLATTLPSRHVADHWDIAWGGFDVILSASLVLTAVALVLRPGLVQAAATATGALLVADAWFDIVLAGSGSERREAILLAAVGELPLALLCLWIALNAERAIRTLGASR
jgi:hypothetical protein